MPATFLPPSLPQVGSYNVNGKKPPAGINLQEWIGPLRDAQGPDVIALGFQEIVPLTAGNAIMGESSLGAQRQRARRASRGLCTRPEPHHTASFSVLSLSLSLSFSPPFTLSAPSLLSLVHRFPLVLLSHQVLH